RQVVTRSGLPADVHGLEPLELGPLDQPVAALTVPGAAQEALGPLTWRLGPGEQQAADVPDAQVEPRCRAGNVERVSVEQARLVGTVRGRAAMVARGSELLAGERVAAV